MSQMIKILSMAIFILVAGIESISAKPEPGDVFREYYWHSPSSDADYGLRVSDLGNYEKGYGGGTITLRHVFDLEHAVKAELIIEKIQSHYGTKELEISINDNEWTPVPETESIQYPQWEYMHHTYPVMEIPLSWLSDSTENGFKMKVSPEQPFRWPQHLINGVHFRIYYDAEIKSHPTGQILEPLQNSALGDSVLFAAEASAPDGEIAQVDFIGLYEDVNYEGDGIYYQWHYHYYHGKITHHIGTASEAPYQVTWDTSWIPDQEQPMQVSARIIDDTDMIFMTQPVTNLILGREHVSVELCKPYNVSSRWTTRDYGKGESFDITGNLDDIVAARLVWTSWCPGYMNGIYINNVKVFDKEGPLYKYYFHRVTLDSLSVLYQGENKLITGYKKTLNGEQIHGMEVQWPGIMVLVKYNTETPVSVSETPVHPAFSVRGNYPNPFNNTTKIRYTLNDNAAVQCRIYSLSGQVIRTLVDTHQKAGDREIIWNGTDDSGTTVASGVYLFNLTAGGRSSTTKMLFMK